VTHAFRSSQRDPSQQQTCPGDPPEHRTSHQSHCCSHTENHASVPFPYSPNLLHSCPVDQSAHQTCPQTQCYNHAVIRASPTWLRNHVQQQSCPFCLSVHQTFHHTQMLLEARLPTVSASKQHLLQLSLIAAYSYQ